MTSASSLFSGKRLWVLAVLAAVILILWGIAGFNAFVTLRGGVQTAWAQVEVQYQRRVDLIPNLVSTVKGAAKFEQDTFREIVEARSAWTQASSIGSRSQQIAAAGSFDTALSRLLVTVEAYPQLQATQAFRDLMTQLEGTENRVAVARKDFNAAVLAYNLRVQRFPSLILAAMFGFDSETLFDASPGSDVAPSVNFAS